MQKIEKKEKKKVLSFSFTFTLFKYLLIKHIVCGATVKCTYKTLNNLFGLISFTFPWFTKVLFLYTLRQFLIDLTLHNKNITFSAILGDWKISQ